MPKVILDKQQITEPSEAEQIAQRWDRAMKRAFKGLVLGGRPTARAQLLRSDANPSNREDESDG